MRTSRFLLTLGLLLTGGAAAADTWSLGYGTVPVTHSYLITNETLNSDSQSEEVFSLGQFMLQHEIGRKVAPQITLTLTTGVGLPAGSQTFDESTKHTNVPAGTSRNNTETEDTTEIAAITVPVLLGGRFGIPMGKNLLTLGASVGGLLVGGRRTVVDVVWAGAPPVEGHLRTTTTYSTVVLPTWMATVNAAFHIKQGENSAITIGLSAGAVGEARFDTETVNQASPLPAGTLATEVDGYKVGGTTFGITAGWSRFF